MDKENKLEEQVNGLEREFRSIRDILGNVSTRNLDLMSKAIRFYGKNNFNRELSNWLVTNRHNFEKED